MADKQERQDQTSQPVPESVPQPAPEPESGQAGVSSKEMEEGKSFAILSYALNFVGLPFFLIPLIMRNNGFSLYHAKQCLIIWLGGIVASIIGIPLCAICIGVILLPAAYIFLLVLNIMGLIVACKGEQKPLPLIGKWGESWFKGINKA